MGLLQGHLQTRGEAERALLPYPTCTLTAFPGLPSDASLPIHSLYSSPLGSKTLLNGTPK